MPERARMHGLFVWPANVANVVVAKVCEVLTARLREVESMVNEPGAVTPRSGAGGAENRPRITSAVCGGAQ